MPEMLGDADGKFYAANFDIHSNRLAVITNTRKGRPENWRIHIFQSRQGNWDLVWQASLNEHVQAIGSPLSADQCRNAGYSELLSFVDGNTLLAGSLVIEGPKWRIAGKTTFAYELQNAAQAEKRNIYSNGLVAIEFVGWKVSVSRRSGLQYELEKTFDLKALFPRE